MEVESICNRNVIVADKNTSVLTAAKLMRQHHVGTIIIIADINNVKKPVGIISDRDLVIKIMARDVSYEKLSVYDVMSRDLICVKNDEEVMEVVRMMCMEGVRRVPVINNEGQLIGILSMDDLFEMLADELSNLAVLICRQQKHEKRLKC